MFQSIVGNIVVVETTPQIFHLGKWFRVITVEKDLVELTQSHRTRDTEFVGDVSEKEIDKCSLESKENSQVTYLLVNEKSIRVGMIIKIQRFSSLSKLC